jgi:AraC-like DNA-binding protein
MNMSPQEYLVNYRLDKACGLLKTTSLPVSNIAAQVGYNDPLSFSKVFKMFHNISPKAYRTQHEELIHASKKGENNSLQTKRLYRL